MSLVYAWPHYVNGRVIGEIRRFFDYADLKKFDVPYYNPDPVEKWTKGTEALKYPWPLMGVDDFVDSSKLLCIGEGQKVRQALAGLGYQAVNCICGSNSAFNTDWSICQRADRVVIFMDDDASGSKFAKEVFQILHTYTLVPSIELVAFKDIKKGGDVCDWLKLQPELKSWNELDPLDDHPAREILRERLDDFVKLNAVAPPEDWEVSELWGEPEPVDSELSSVHRLPSAMVPLPLRAWVEDVSYRMQCPREYVAVSAIVAVGAAIGGQCAIRPKRQDDWAVHPNLWGIICGPPGTMKSAAMSAALTPLQVLESAAAEQNDKLRKDYEAKKLAYDEKLSNAKASMKKAVQPHERMAEEENARNLLDQEPAPPVQKRFIVHNSTMEALCPILQDNPKGVLVFQDELAGLLHSWEKEGRQQERPFYMTAWNGREPYTVDRKTSAPVRINSATVSILGGTQPDLFRRYMEEQADGNNDGLMQRFQLAVYLTPAEAGSDDIIDETPDIEAKYRLQRIISNLADADYVSAGAQTDSVHNSAPFFRFTEDANQFFFTWAKENKRRTKKAENSFYGQHLDKYNKLMPALALIFHLIYAADIEDATGNVTIESAKLAAAWCAWLAEHARRIYGLAQPEEQTIVKRLAEKIRTRKLVGDFKVRDLVKSGWSGLTEHRPVELACDELVEARWLRKTERKPDGRGRPSVFYSINPKVGAMANGRSLP